MSLKSWFVFSAVTAFVYPFCAHAQPLVTATINHNGTTLNGSDPTNIDVSDNVDPVFVEAHANLATGIFRGASRVSVSDLHGATDGSWAASMTDLLILVGPGSAPVPVTLNFRVDGSFFWDNALGPSQTEYMTMAAHLDFGNQHSGFGSQHERSDNGMGGVIDYFHQDYSGDVVGATVSEPFIDVTLKTTFDLMPGSGAVFSADVSGMTDGTYGPGCGEDFLHTGAMSVTVPAGYSFTSGSGVFLTQSTPETAPFAVLGLGALTCFRRRGRRPNAAPAA